MTENPFRNPQGERTLEREKDPRVAEIFLQGRRSEQQDRYAVTTFVKDGQSILGIVVADGHGVGGEHAAYLATHVILKRIQQEPELNEKTVCKMFAWTHEHILYHADTDFGIRGGTTATAVFLRKNIALIGWVGDSQARVLSTDGQFRILTLPHEIGLGNERETARLIARGANLEGKFNMKGDLKHGRMRKGHNFLNMSRALGDEDMEPFVEHVPETKQLVLSPDERFLIIASDGLWKPLERTSRRHRIEKLLAGCDSADEAKQKLLEQLSKWRLDDNTTIVIVDLHKK